MREAIIEKVLQRKIVAIVRGVYGDDCVRLAEALAAGGIGLMEVTFDQSAANAVELTGGAIRAVAAALGERMEVGAGTVTSVELVRAAAEAGAKFIVSPDVNEDVIRETVRLGMVSMPGALTPTECMVAHRAGADFVKLFPAGELGTGYLKAIRSPLNHIRFLAVGGVGVGNLADFLKAGALGAGIGGSLVSKDLIRAGRFDEITATAKALVAAAQG